MFENLDRLFTDNFFRFVLHVTVSRIRTCTYTWVHLPYITSFFFIRGNPTSVARYPGTLDRQSREYSVFKIQNWHQNHTARF